MSERPPILVVGAGLAGLACVRSLVDAGVDATLLEGSRRVGGRLGSTVVDGIVCDLGFQVSMSNYRSLASLVPERLVPRHDFEAGAAVVTDRGGTTILDPARRPFAAASPLFTGFVKPGDLLAAYRLRRDATKIAHGGHVPGTASDQLDRCGFSERFRSEFLRPFFSGVLLDENLDVPADRFLDTVHRFATGRAQLPEGGMQSIAEAMADPIRDRIEFGAVVRSLGPEEVLLEDGTRRHASSIVLATPVDVTRRLLDLEALEPATVWSSTTAVHFRATAPHARSRLITLDGRSASPLNLVCTPTAIAPGYAPDGVDTVLSSLRPGRGNAPSCDLDLIRRRTADLLEVDPSHLEHVATTEVPAALPRPALPPLSGELPRGVRLAGDHLTSPSIEHAIQSGLEAADAITNDRDRSS